MANDIGEIVTDIQKIDPDWWLVKNEAGQASYFLDLDKQSTNW